jgi:hypothetical protein
LKSPALVPDHLAGGVEGEVEFLLDPRIERDRIERNLRRLRLWLLMLLFAAGVEFGLSAIALRHEPGMFADGVHVIAP